MDLEYVPSFEDGGSLRLLLHHRQIRRQHLYSYARSNIASWAFVALSVDPRIVGLYTVTLVCTPSAHLLSSLTISLHLDTDVVIWEGDPDDPTLKPPEMYTLVENFCLGLRRLELFARGKTLRRGWVSVLAEGEEERIQDVVVEDDGEGVTQAKVWDKDLWEREVKELAKGSGGRMVVPMTSGEASIDRPCCVFTDATHHHIPPCRNRCIATKIPSSGRLFQCLYKSHAKPTRSTPPRPPSTPTTRAKWSPHERSRATGH